MSATHTPLGAAPATWEQQIAYALGKLDPNGLLTAEEHLPRFEARYGRCAMENLLSLAHSFAGDIERLPANFRDEDETALTSGGERHEDEETDDAESEQWVTYLNDVRFVLLMLGVGPEHPQAEAARSALLPFLEYPSQIERWTSAISLGHLHDERALPQLLEMLTEGLPLPAPWLGESESENNAQQQAYWEQFEQAMYEINNTLGIRNQVPHVLWRWGAPSVVSALRQTLQLMARIADTAAHPNAPRPWFWGQAWRMYVEHLVTALARLGAFGALVGVELPGDAEQHVTWQNGFRVLMCLVAAQEHFEDAGYRGQIAPAEVRPEVERLLEEQFGLDEEERRVALEPYHDHQFWLDLD